MLILNGRNNDVSDADHKKHCNTERPIREHSGICYFFFFSFMNYKQIYQKYKEAGQEHVFTFFDQLTDKEKENFLVHLSLIDPKQVTEIYQTAISPSSPCQLEPIDQENVSHSDSQWYEQGLNIISKNQVAVILMAGGQGTRLGSFHPKGCYDIGLPSHKSLFQLQAERIIRLQQLANNAIIPWYIMTSDQTHDLTVKFFLNHSFFGLLKENVIFFKQGEMPCFDLQGKLILQEKNKLALAPDGNGGIYNALLKQGIIQSLKDRGILYSHCYCVDNSLTKVADPIFIGYCVSRNTDCGIKVVEKNDPKEPVGVVARRNGHYAVVEYSEISTDLAHQRQQDGHLLFGSANIANHFFSTDFLNRISCFDELKYHVAKKKIPYIDLKTGESILPTKPNGVKLERFVFDIFVHSQSFSVLEVDRQEEFSPLKNGPGTGIDCPETSREDILKQSKRFIINAGGYFKNQDIQVEVSPLLSYAGENLQAISGKTIQKSVILNHLQDLEFL